MKFVDRINEIKELNRVLDRGTAGEFVVVYGRRRLGKSTLLKHVLHKNDIYFMATDMVDNVQISMFRDQLAKKFPELSNLNFNQWHDLLNMVNRLADEPFTICMDEFPYLVKSSPSLPSVLQWLIDSGDMKFNLVICGSSQRMMQNLVLSADEPLYGRANAIINLQPIPVQWMMEALNIDARQAVEEHSVWGGVPRYWELREQYQSLGEAIQGTMLQTNGALFGEPQRLFLDNMTSAVQSESLMSVIATGANRMSEIAARTGRTATSLSTPLDKLIQMNYLRREFPFGESPRKSKKGIYRINDPLMNFYYTFVVPNLSTLGRGRSASVMDLINSRMGEYVGRHWEYLCREAVSGNNLYGHIWGEAARWWGSVPDSNHNPVQMEFDVIAESADRRALLVGECKWTNPEIAAELRKKLLHKASMLPQAKGKEIIPILFLREEPKDAMSPDILLPADVVPLTWG